MRLTVARVEEDFGRWNKQDLVEIVTGLAAIRLKRWEVKTYVMVNWRALRRECATEEGPQEWIEGVHPIDIEGMGEGF